MRYWGRQRVYGLVAGYEDLNDFDTLRHDPLLQTVTGRIETLAARRLCVVLKTGRIGGRPFAVNELWSNSSMGSFAEEPEEIILDFDAPDNPVHGLQEDVFSTVIMIITVFCRYMFFAVISCWWPTCRPSRSMPASMPGPSSNCWLNGFANSWPRKRIIWRADSGFCRDRILSWCDRNEVSPDIS